MSNLNVSDQSRANEYRVLFNVVAASGNSFTPAQENLFNAGVMLFIRVTAVTTDLTVTIHARDEESGVFTPLVVSPAIAAPGNSLLTVYPGIEVIANQQASIVLPVSWLVQAFVSGVGTADFIIGANLIV